MPLNAAGRRVPRRLHAYECIWPEPDLPLPDSITTAHGFSRRRARCHMTTEEGAVCPTYEPLR